MTIGSITGLAILAGAKHGGVKYFACFLALSGIFANVPQGAAWNGNNIGGSVKRGVGLAMHIGCVSNPMTFDKTFLIFGQGNLGGAVAGFVFRPDDAPHFRSGHGILIAAQSMSLVLALVMTLYVRRENARRDRTYKAPSEYSEEEMKLESDKGDYASFFRYTI